MREISSRFSHQKGQSLTELAISITFILILIAGMVDVGRAIFYYLSLRDAVQEGMVYGVAYPNFCEQIVGAVRSSANDASLDVSVKVGGVDCSLAGPTQACAGKAVVITATQPHFPITMPFIGGFIGTQNLTLSATIQGTVIRPDCP